MLALTFVRAIRQFKFSSSIFTDAKLAGLRRQSCVLNSLPSVYLPQFTARHEFYASRNCSAINHLSHSPIFHGFPVRFLNTNAAAVLPISPECLSAEPYVNVIASKPSATAIPKSVVWWLFGCSALVFGMVVLGGVTRLTESGLSITEWKPVTGTIPPLSEEDWQREFDKYQKTPEYMRVHNDFTMSDFKRIYGYEYTHRLLGRILGLVYAVPMVYFIARGHVTGHMRSRLLILGGLLAGQGALGWYMVKSGLRDELHHNGEQPRVSPYRLASHLGAAFVLYSGMFVTALKMLHADTHIDLKKSGSMPHLLLLRSRWGSACKTIVFLTALSGAFVAGLDAGLTYNTFPKMAGKWIPDDLLAMTPAWRNAFENPTTAQFIHRILGMSVVSLITATWFIARKAPISGKSRLALNSMFIMAYLQATLGISTLLTYVPIPLAATHQAGSLTLLSLSLWFWHTLRYIPK